MDFFRLHYPEKVKEEELSVYFRVDFYFFLFLFLVSFSGLNL